VVRKVKSGKAKAFFLTGLTGRQGGLDWRAKLLAWHDLTDEGGELMAAC
jgi:hypothetical protein